MWQRHPGLPRVLGSVSVGHLCWTQRRDPPECRHLRAPSRGESRAARAGVPGAAAAVLPCGAFQRVLQRSEPQPFSKLGFQRQEGNSACAQEQGGSLEPLIPLQLQPPSTFNNCSAESARAAR